MSNSGTNQQWILVPVSGQFWIYNGASGKVASVGGSVTNGGKVVQYLAWDTPSDGWSLVETGSGYVKLVNLATNLALEVPASSTTDGTGLDQWAYNGGTNQQWQLTLGVGGGFVLTNRNSGKVMDDPGYSIAPGTQLDQYSGNSGANQRWFLFSMT